MMSFLAIPLGDLHIDDVQRPARGKPNDRSKPTRSLGTGIVGGGNVQIAKSGKPSGQVYCMSTV
jgi:hypothetical protein